MAGNFTSPNASTKMKVGKVNRPKRTSPTGHGMSPLPEHPITDSFARKSIPGFMERRSNTNNKSGWNTTPAKPPAGRLAQCAGPVNRGVGKVVRHREAGKDANSHGSGGTQRR